MSRLALAVLVACALLATGVETCDDPPPERTSDCRTVKTEEGISTECGPPDDEWSERALDEAEEGMREREPGSRPY